jgi:hypothetical protein
VVFNCTEDSEVFVEATELANAWRESGYQSPEVDEEVLEDDIRGKVRLLPGMQ